MGELRALLSREWILSRRWTLVLAALTALGYAALYVLCRPEDRYRLLCDPALVRRVALIGALASGGALAYRSFAHEIRGATWEHLLMAPVSRGTIVAAKFLFGALGLFALTAVPMVALWAIVASSSVTGGPVLTLPELFVHSILGRALLVGVVSYSAGAAAALSLRTHNRVFWAPLVSPALLFFVTNTDRGEAKLPFIASLLLLALAALALLHVARETDESGAVVSERLRVLRATSTTPLVMVALVFGGTMANDLRMRSAPYEHVASEDRRVFGVADDGHIGWHARTRRSGMYQLRPREAQRAERERYWAPDLFQNREQYFLDHHRNVFLAYDHRSGRARGCIGRDGPRDRDCAEFSSRPSFIGGGTEFVLFADRVAILAPGQRRVETIYRGPVDRAAYMGQDDVALVVQSGDELVAIHRAEEEQGEHESTPRLRAEVLCRGLARFGHVQGVAIEDRFVALVAGHAYTAEEQTWVVCRNGVVAESQSHRETRGLSDVPARPMRDVVMATMLGPIGSLAMDVERHYVIRGEYQVDRPIDRRPVWALAVASAMALAIARRRATSVVATLAAIAIGPAFVLAWALVHSKRLARR